MDLGVELHTFQRRGRAGQAAVAHAHDLAVFRGGGDFQTVGQRRTFDGQRVVADDAELRRQALVDTAPVGGWIVLALPCICTWARTTLPPSAAPMAWWPRHTPSSGSLPVKCWMASTQMPASAGLQGPGDSTSWSGRNRQCPAP
jgi:hypothetical protein